MTRHLLPALLAAFLLSVAVLAALTLGAEPASAQQDPPICPSTMPAGADDLTCRCWGPGNASVWGTDVYTDDSGLCTAAVHAGAIPASGGVVSVHARAGLNGYSGSTRNGISTSDYGSWRRSIVFDNAACPSRYNENGTSWSGTCSCSGVGSGSVWGSGPYTTDSDLCRAARHAGVIGPGGGVVQVAGAPGRASYAGSSRNGVTTSSWGSYGSSFTVSK